MSGSGPYLRLDEIRELLARVPQGRADHSLRRFRDAVGGVPDLTQPDHVRVCRVWLNRWGCRIGYPADDEGDALVPAMAAWWQDWGSRLPAGDRQLADLSDAELETLAGAFTDLDAVPATSRRRLRSTAAAKLLFALRPLAVTAWDLQIAKRPAANGNFLAHLTDARAYAQSLLDEAGGRGIGDVPVYVGRVESSLAKIIDEVLYLTITRGQ